jgi:hypothetical protein
MPAYHVTVEDSVWSTHLIQVHARNPEEAKKKASCAEEFVKPITFGKVLKVVEIAL